MRALVVALGLSGLLLLPATAAAQSCPTGQVYCSAGWCCPTTGDGGTNVCCNGNPQSAGCTTTGYCGMSSGDGGAASGDGGAPVCPSGDLYCAAGWCCPPGMNGRTDVCCNMNPMANGCTSNGNCSTGAGSSGSGGSSGGLTPPPGCGTSQTFNVISCGSNAFCPANATCVGTSCQCSQGFVALDCSDNVCNGMCSAPNYWCAPSSAVNGSSSGGSGGGGGSSGGSGGGGSGGSKGCDAAGVDMNGAAPWFALVAGAVGIALWRGRRSARSQSTPL